MTLGKGQGYPSLDGPGPAGAPLFSEASLAALRRMPTCCHPPPTPSLGPLFSPWQSGPAAWKPRGPHTHTPPLPCPLCTSPWATLAPALSSRPKLRVPPRPWLLHVNRSLCRPGPPRLAFCPRCDHRLPRPCALPTVCRLDRRAWGTAWPLATSHAVPGGWRRREGGPREGGGFWTRHACTSGGRVASQDAPC